ncbi:DUF262 domain-containing protein [uncultured Deinococcus sp.]|uniref:DUF262 domain-containing protein n=1 Tax=uncultured Deinococcus sp. TaxID=158789 RepID=UPI002585FA67|nr:DUF262 domain-containing protein [uncultured Deinococcus sp.]
MSDELIEDIDSQPINPPVPNENSMREIVTSVVDYNLGTIDSLIRNSTIDLRPSYQRRNRWDEIRQSALIESFLMNVPVPPIFLNEDSYGIYSVIDGQQRLTALNNFMSDQLKLIGLSKLKHLNGSLFSELPRITQSKLITRANLRAIIILRQSDPDIKLEVFSRLNTGGIKLNAQEVRNASFAGGLNDLILELSQNTRLHSMLGIEDKNKSPIYKEMKDAELVLRYLTFSEDWELFTGGVAKHMDSFMENNTNPTDERKIYLKNDFELTLEKVYRVFGNDAFRRWNPTTGKWRRPVLASLFDTQMLALRNFDLTTLSTHSSKIVEEFQILFEDKLFLKEINAAIPSYFTNRIERLIKIVNEEIARA